MEKIKVLMVGSEITLKGGMTTVVLSFLKHKFKNITITYMPTHYDCNIFIGTIRFLLNMPILISKIKQNDIVHMHMSERGSCIRKIIVFKLSKIYNKKVILHMHGAEFKEYYNNTNKWIKSKINELLLGCDYVLTLGENWNNFIKEINDNIKCKVYKNAISIPKEVKVLSENQFNILFLAIIDKRKGIYDLVEAAKLLIKRYSGEKTINFIIAGTGKEEKNIKELVKLYKIDNYFYFIGWVNEEKKRELLRKSHLFVLPSYNEGLPMSILEAISYGIPVISTDVGSINEAVINDLNGYLIKPGNYEELYDKMNQLIDDNARCLNMGENSKKLACKEFDSVKYFLNIEKLYNFIM